MKARIFARLFVFASLAFFTASGQAQQSLQVLHRHVRPAVSSRQAALAGSLPQTQRLNLTIVLPLRNQSELTSLLSRLYDPSSPDYRHFLSVDQFTQQFGPTAEDYQAVVDFARANGFTVTGTPANRMIVPISGSVAQIEKTFNVRMNNYQHPTEKRTFYSPDREPSLNLSVPVAHISGLNNFSIPHPMVTKASADQVTASPAVTGSGPGGAYLASDMRAAYYTSTLPTGSTALTGSGQTVGFVEFDGYQISDVTESFDGTATSSGGGSNYVIAYTPTAGGTTYTIQVNNVLLDGATGASVSGNDSEEALDIVQAIGMAPGLSQVRVYIGNSDVDILNAMVSDNIAKQISISWLWSPDDPETDDFIFQELAAQGQSVFTASGDYGTFSLFYPYFYPAEDAWVTAVGGTSLITNGAGGTWSSEVAWHQSGGGISPDDIPIPNWQAGVANSANGGSATSRNVPDVAAEADFDNYDCNMGVCQGNWAGTSFAAPRWAGFMALVNGQAAALGEAPIGFLNPLLYSIGGSAAYATTFHDITSGNNDYYLSTPVSYNAVSGYDLVTGWGSPAVQKLIDAVTPAIQTGFQLSSSPSSLIIQPGASAPTTITVNRIGDFVGAVTLSLPALPPGVTASFSANTVSTSSILTVTVDTNTPRGSFLLMVNGSANGQSSSAYIAVEVDAPGFMVSPVYPVVWITPDYASSTILNITDFAGFTGTPDLAITSPLPSGVTAVLNPNSLSTSSVLTFIGDDSAPPSQNTITASATSGNASATRSVYLAVMPPLFEMDISREEMYLAQGEQIAFTISAHPVGNYSGGMIDLGTYTLPDGVTATFNPTSIAVGQTSTLTLTASASAALKTFYLGVTGLSGGTESDIAYPMTTTAAPTPWFSVTPEFTYFVLPQGGSFIDSFTVTDEDGFSGTAWLEPAYPRGASVSIQQTDPVTGSGVVTYTGSNTAMPSIWSASGYAYVGSQPVGAQQAPFFTWILVTPTVPFTLGAPSGPLTLVPGGSTSASISITPQNGFSGSAEMSATGLPDGMTASFDSNPTAGDCMLTVDADASVSPGSYYVNISAIAEGQTLIRTITLQVGGIPTTTALSINPTGNTLTTGESYTLTATVSPSSGSTTPTGNVIFTIGSATQTAGLNSSGVAIYNGTAPMVAGGLALSAAYQGTTQFSASTSNTLSETVVPISTTTALSINPTGNTLTTGESYTLTATVSPSSGSTTPTGNVIFTIGSATQTAGLNSSGVATYNGTAPETAGGLTISSAYQGTSTFSASTSNTLSETIIPAVNPGMSLTGTSVIVEPGATTGNTSTITVTPAGGFTGSVALTAAITSSPAGAQYPPTLSFGSTTPVSITGANSGTATLTISTTAATSASLANPVHRAFPWYTEGGAALACILLLGIPARRRRWRTIFGLLALIVTLTGGVLACGGGGNGSVGSGGNSNPGTTAGAYTITVTGTSGTTTAAGTVTLNVQ